MPTGTVLAGFSNSSKSEESAALSLSDARRSAEWFIKHSESAADLVSNGQPEITPEMSKKLCDRIVYRNKYERNAPEIRNWWYYLFNMLEEDAAIPPEQKLTVLMEIFPIPLLNKILKICSTRSRKFKNELDVLSNEDIYRKKVLVKVIEKEEVSDVLTNKRLMVSHESQTSKNELPLKQDPLGKDFALPDLSKSKMYTDFFKRKPNRAAVWRTLPPLLMDEMNLNQKAEAITEQIAKDFIDWLRDLGGDEELSLSVQSVIEMFEIGFHANSATSLRVNVKEMPSVPKRVAEAKNRPEKAKRTVLHNEIAKDIKASKKKTTYTAFGRRLPYDMQVRPPAENYFRKWMSCDRVPEKLASMAAVWQGITHLKSTRAYCEFLLERPEIKPPKYLLDCGMMDLQYLKDTDVQSEIVSFGNGLD